VTSVGSRHCGRHCGHNRRVVDAMHPRTWHRSESCAPEASNVVPGCRELREGFGARLASPPRLWWGTTVLVGQDSNLRRASAQRSQSVTGILGGALRRQTSQFELDGCDERSESSRMLRSQPRSDIRKVDLVGSPRMAGGRTWVASVPAEKGSKQSPARRRRKPSAIYLRAELCVHRNRTRWRASPSLNSQLRLG
jgi:hypothetical protein